MSELFTKHTSASGKVTYKPYVPTIAEEPSCKLSDSMTEGEIVTAVGGLAVMAIHGYKVLMPEHKMVARKVSAVEAAVLSMFKDTGSYIDTDVIDHIISAWDQTMQRLSGVQP